MIKLLVFVVVALAVQDNLDAALARLPPQNKPPGFEGQKGCYVPALKKVLKFNEKYAQPNTNCTQYICQTNGETLIETCGAKAAGKGCTKVPGNWSLKYPDCCDQVLCNATDTTTGSPLT